MFRMGLSKYYCEFACLSVFCHFVSEMLSHFRLEHYISFDWCYYDIFFVVENIEFFRSLLPERTIFLRTFFFKSDHYMLWYVWIFFKYVCMKT